MNAALITAMNFMMKSFGKKKEQRVLTQKEKKEIEKLNSKGLLSAINHLKNK